MIIHKKLFINKEFLFSKAQSETQILVCLTQIIWAAYNTIFVMGFPDLKIPSLNISESLLPFLLQPRNAVSPSDKFPIHHWPVVFSKFEECDAIPHLHKVRGQKFNRPILYQADYYCSDKEAFLPCHFQSIYMLIGNSR